MRKLFFRYFFSIFAITVISLVIQNGLLLFKYSRSQNKWKDFIYYDFIDNVENNLIESSFPEYSIDSISLFKSALEADSRVSGFLVRNPDGRISFAVEQSSEGMVLSPVNPRETPGFKPDKSISMSGNDTVLNITYNGRTFDINRSFAPERKRTINIPQNVNANDVIGTVTIMFESQPLTSIDILTFSPRTYKYSKDIINACLDSIMIAIPICLLISIVLSCIISSKNARYINSIRMALNDLSKGKNNVKLDNNKNNELNEITVAVSELDQKLQANKRSRQAWLTSISHDLNTPATGMKMIIDGLNDGVFKPNKTTLRELQIENNTLCERIDRVIEYSSLQADVKLSVETVRCSDLFNSIAPAFAGTVFNINTEEIKCDKKYMVKAVNELLGNAFAASQNTGVSLTVGKDDVNYTIEVSNSGKLPEGFSCSEFYEPWVKGDSSRSTNGNGLGLAIVGSIAKLHGGAAFISEKDGTVTATVQWPL